MQAERDPAHLQAEQESSSLRSVAQRALDVATRSHETLVSTVTAFDASYGRAAPGALHAALQVDFRAAIERCERAAAAEARAQVMLDQGSIVETQLRAAKEAAAEARAERVASEDKAAAAVEATALAVQVRPTARAQRVMRCLV